jgi:homoserine kinase type II
MTKVYDLWFTREYENREDTKLHIGIYASETDAKAAVEVLKDKPGFREHPSGFEIHEAELGRTGWEEGFVTKFGPPPKDAGGEAFDLPAWITDAAD